MDKEQMVKDAVALARKQGVRFSATTPSFRPKNEDHKVIAHIQILFSWTGNQIKYLWKKRF